MALYRERQPRPTDWKTHAQKAAPRWTIPFHALEWIWSWMAYYLGRWALIELLEYIQTLSILIAIVFYFAETGKRVKERHYQAWGVINSAQGKGGNGGRIEALEQLVADKVPLTGVDLSNAFLMSVSLPKAKLARSSFQAADARKANLAHAQLDFSNLSSANFRNANLSYASLQNVDLEDADLNGAVLQQANLSGADLSKVDLRGTDLKNVKWSRVANWKLANIFGAVNVPEGLAAAALKDGAVSIESDETWNALCEENK